MFKMRKGDLLNFLEKTFLYPSDSSKYKKCRNILVAIYCVVTLLISTVATYYGGFKKTIEQTAFFVVIGFITNGQQIYIMCNQHKIKKMVDILHKYKKGHLATWQNDMFKKDSDWIWSSIRYHYMIMESYCVLYVSAPFLVDLIAGSIKDDWPVYRIPLPCQGLIDGTKPRSFENVVFSLIGISWAVFSVQVHLGVEAFMYVSIVYTRIELKMVKEKLLIITDLINRKEKNYRIKRDQLMKDVTIHHQMTLEGLDILKDTLGFPIGLQNTVFSICFCIDLYALTTFDSKESWVPAFRSSFTLTAIGLVLFSLCQIGESLETTNNELYYTLYKIPWYQEEPRFRAYLNTMVRQARRPFVINYHRSANLNLHSFMQIINTSYSYFMMLKSTTSD